MPGTFCGRCSCLERAGGRKFRCVVYNISEACSLICLSNENYGLRGSKFQPSHHCGMKASSIFPVWEEMGEPPNRLELPWEGPQHQPQYVSPHPLQLLQLDHLICTSSTLLYPVLFSMVCTEGFSTLSDQHKCSYIECSLAPCLMGMSCLPQEKWAGIWSEFSSDSWHPALCWACNGNSVHSICCDD